MKGIVKTGTWGASSGTVHNIAVAPKQLKSVTVRSIDTIDSITFQYEGEDGKQHKDGPWGGMLGYDHTFTLKPNEYVKEVSGTFGPFKPKDQPCTVNSLLFVTNQGKYGPFGKESGTSFNIPVEDGGSIVGFHAHADSFVSAIGFYVRPSN